MTNIVDSYVYGFALQEKTLPVSTPEELAALGPEILAGYAGRYPHLETAAEELIASGFRYGDEFEPGLDLILAALKRERVNRQRGSKMTIAVSRDLVAALASV